MNPWLCLMAAGFFEVGWPLGFKLAQTAPAWRVPAVALSILSMALSGWLLFLAQKYIPIGTAYAVWTGIGAAGTFLIGIIFFGDILNWARALGVMLIVGGVVTLKTVTP
ncbi:MAG: multidrug efflux SMR transporter [Desulfovibrio sp.]|nr:multidrug efflux SMR transporter [Desulfovibrio sp.]